MNSIAVERRVVGNFRRGRLGVMEIRKTHIKGFGMSDCMMGNGCEVWEGMEGMV